MKKSVSFFLALCLVFGAFAVTFPATVLAAGQKTLELNYTDSGVNDGISSNRKTATLSTVTKNGMTVMKVVPNPTHSDSTSRAITLDHYSYASRNIDLASLKSISLYVYYDAGSTSLQKPQLRILPGSNSSLTTSEVKVYSNETITKGSWFWLTFDFSTNLPPYVTPGAVLSQFQFYPYGQGTYASTLTTSDSMYISKVRLVYTETASSSDSYLLSFVPGRPDVTGSKPMADRTVNVGDTITLPANTYSRPGYTFSSYVCSVNQFVTYQPGQTFTVPAVPAGEGVFEEEPHLYFIPTSTPTTVLYDGCEPVKTVNYSDWFSSINSLGSGYANVERDVMFDGRRTLCVEPITDCANPRSLALDSYDWQSLPWNLDYYKYATVEYYFDTTNNVLSSYYPRLYMTVNGGALTGAQSVKAKEKVVSGRWAILNFDLTNVSLKNSSIQTGLHILKQFHFLWQPDNENVTQFSSGTKLYIGAITLFHEKPAETPQLKLNYMKGDTDGTFRPHDKLTKAESAQLLYNILKIYSLYTLPSAVSSPFSDVTDTSLWYYKSVATLATLGVIPPASTFLPDTPITRQELAVYLQNAIFLLNASSIAGTTLFGSGETLTRGEAAAILNHLAFEKVDNTTSNNILENARMIRFKDVHPQLWSYADIVAATSPQLSYTKNGTETLLALLTDTVSSLNDPEAYDTSAGDAKIAEIDAQTDSRIAEIRATANTVVPSAWTSGVVYYLSSTSGSTSNAGTSSSAPRKISSLNDVSNLSLNSGDAVLFKRGDTFRGQLTAVAGVTYSAYGTGNKPVFTRNTEGNAAASSKWTLDYSDSTTGAKIWKYNANAWLPDAGAIMLIKGSDIDVAYKEIPDYYGGQWYVRGTSRSKTFDYKTELDHDLEFFQNDPPSESSALGKGGPSAGYVYLRCDAGNPGTVYSQIEFCLALNCIAVGTANNVTIDNICIKFFGAHGIGAGSVKNLTVTNCEIGWGGGAIQNFTDGKVTRYGNGVEVYGGLENYTIDNCYVYQIYDAGITHQVGKSKAGNFLMENVVFSNNVLEYSTYNIEYFLTQYSDGTGALERFMKDISFDSNIIRKAGYGWGVQRTENEPSNIKGWNNDNNKAIGFTITNNIVDRTMNLANGNGTNDWLVQIGTGFTGCEPYMEGNTFLQVPGRQFIQSARSVYRYNSDLPAVANAIGCSDNTYYFCSEGPEEVGLGLVYHGVIK